MDWEAMRRQEIPAPFIPDTKNANCAISEAEARAVLAFDDAEELLVDAAGVAHTREDWLLLGETGERLEIHARYERGVARRGTTTTRFYSPQDPSQVQVFKVESGIDIMRNATVPVRDRVSEMRYVASGGRFSALFDGSERVLSIDAFPWYDRLILKP
jgi:hypothetical protein